MSTVPEEGSVGREEWERHLQESCKCMAVQLATEIDNSEVRENWRQCCDTIDRFQNRTNELGAQLEFCEHSCASTVNGELLDQCLASASELEKIYARIDVVESFISRVKNSITALEEYISIAESETSTAKAVQRKIGTAFKRMFGKKSTANVQLERAGPAATHLPTDLAHLTVRLDDLREGMDIHSSLSGRQ